MENSDKEIEILHTSEIDIAAIISYAAIHKGLTKDMIVNYSFPDRKTMGDWLTALNIGYDYGRKKPYNWGIASIELIRKVYLACQLNHNLGDICWVDRLPACDLLTFSFPCTDLATCGRQRGIVKNETRSGLVYEILRILSLQERDNLPKILIMENVASLLNKRNIAAYKELNKEFEAIGYKCKYQVMNAMNYGIPQNRERVFAVYMLDEEALESYVFPEKEKLLTRAEDYLEEVSATSKYIVRNERAEEFLKNLTPDKIKDSTTEGLIYLGALKNNLWLKNGKDLSRNQRQGYRVYSASGVCPGLATNVGGFGVVSSLLYDTKRHIVRKLSPEEAFKFMGMNKEDCLKCREVGITDTQLYRQAGNGLVTGCISKIVNNL